MKPLIIKALECENGGRPPFWIMRQAGRYLPSYRQLRTRHALGEMFRTPELAAEVTLLPIQEIGFDAAILFSDILLIAEVFGLKVAYPEEGGPAITPPLTAPPTVQREVREALQYVEASVRLVKKELKVPLIGFCGGPFTVASYMIEGGAGHKELKKTKEWMYRDPEGFHRLLKKITAVSIDLLKMQVAAGADLVQIFDSWANVLSRPHFLEFCLKYLQEMVEALRGTKVILFCRGSSLFPEELAALNPAGISFDWHQELHVLRRSVPRSIAVQGNIDPHLLKAPWPHLEAEVKKHLLSMQNDPGFIFNLGHGILPDTPVDNVRRLAATIQQHRSC